MFGTDKTALREMYFDAWYKHEKNQILTPLEHIIINVIQLHPEFIPFFQNKDNLSEELINPETGKNQFLHFGLHMAVREQLQADNPKGIRALFKQVCHAYIDTHEAEHQLMVCLVNFMQESMKSNQPPNHQEYIKKIKKLVG